MGNQIFTPLPELQTGRLALRQLIDSDAGSIFALRSDSGVNRYLARKPSASIEDAKQFIEAINRNIQINATFYWAIILKDTNALIGTICLFDFSDAPSKAEIGFELLPPFQGKGFMQEAGSKVIQFGFELFGLRSIEASTHPQNQSSIRLLEKLKFRDGVAAGDTLVFHLTHGD